MGPLPDWIEWCVLKVRVIFVHQGKQGRVGVSALHWCEIFTVLDEPKAPMSPAWVSVLRISCRWARGKSIWKEAANTLTDRVWENCRYDNVFRHHFEGWQNTEIGTETTEETFHLKHFLSDPLLRGNCNALTNFLCCLMTSVGIEAIVQRTNRVILHEDGIKGGRWTFATKPIWPAGRNGLKGQRMQWGYHQFVLIGEKVWDGNLVFVISPTEVRSPVDVLREKDPPAGVEFGSRNHWEAEGCETYFCWLIDFAFPTTDPNYRWETNHPTTKFTSGKLKVTTEIWQSDGCF